MSAADAILKQIFSKKDKTLLAKEAENPDEGFIPYVCYYDKNTILTKNGELLKIIKISGFKHEDDDISSVRQAIRQSLLDNIPNTKFAFWFHTIRRKQELHLTNKFSEFLANKINQTWSKASEINSQFTNDLYISIIIEGIDTSIKNFGALLKSLSYAAVKSSHSIHLQRSYSELSLFTDKILKTLAEHDAKLIGIREDDGILFSDAAKFFGKITNLKEQDRILSAAEITEELLDSRFLFGNRELEIISDQKNFATIFSIKEYHEISEDYLKNLMQLPLEFIVTQSFDFSKNKSELEFIQSANNILNISQDEDFRQISGLAELAESNPDDRLEFGKLQTTIMIISKNQDELKDHTLRVLEELQNLGIIAIREDIFLEHCFWSQLPANFRFLRRQKTALARHFAGFATLNNMPLGRLKNNHWGEAVTILKTILSTPYFFNFHSGNLGHTLITGPKGSRKTVLTNFLLAQARKFNYKLFYFDKNKSSEVFIKGMGGSYFRAYDRKNSQENHPDLLKINPFLLPNNSSNKLFLARWLRYLLAFSNEPIKKSELALIPQIVDKIYEKNIKSLADAHELFHQRETLGIYKKLEKWCKTEKLSYIFNHQEETPFDNIMGFDLDSLQNSKTLAIPTFTYLLHKITKELDGSPVIIVIDDAWQLVDNKIVAPLITNLLEKVAARNCMMIFASEPKTDISKTQINDDLLKYMATELYMPDKNPNEFYKTVLKLSDEEVNVIKLMEEDKGHFYIRHEEDAIIATLNLNNYPEIFKILSANEFVLNLMEKI